jgi:hypothetical protein
MAIVFDGPVTPDAATLYIRSLPSPSDLLLSAIFPDRLVTKNTIDISELTRRNRTARFRAYDARLHVSERDTATLRQVKLPALSSSITVGEFERLQIEMTRLAGTDYSSIVDAVYDDLTNLTAEVRNRMEQARGDVLTDGKLTFAGEGQLTMEADYGVPGDLGYTAWGVSATALELVNSSAVDFSFQEAPGIVGVVEKIGPPYREFVFVDAVGMPVLQNARLLMVADVA